MRRPVVSSRLAFGLTALVAVLAITHGADVEADLQTLRMRVKDMEAAGAKHGFSVFSFKLAGLLTSASSSVASSYLSPEDLNVAKTLANACNGDIESLCTSVPAVPAGGPVPDAFHHNLDVMECLSDNFRSVSDGCIDAAHSTITYMSTNKDTLRLAMKKTAIADVFQGFKTACASEIAEQCPVGALAVDPTAALNELPGDGPSPPRPASDSEDEPRDRRHGRPSRRLHRAEHSSEEERLPNKDAEAVGALSSQLKDCVESVVPVATETCGRAIEALSHVSRFVLKAHDHEHGPHGPIGKHRRSLFGGKFDGPSGDLPKPPMGKRWDDDESLSEDEDDDRSGNNRRSHRRHHKDDGGFVGVVMLVAIIAMSVCLCRRRRQIRNLMQRINQLEMAAFAGQVQQQQQNAARQQNVAVGMPVPVTTHVHIAPSAPQQQRVASESTEESSGLLQRPAAYPQQGSFPGQPFTF